MIVDKIIIHNFKSIAKDCELRVGNNMTSLVGANQSGKTNILRAIERFDSGEYQPDDVCDFSVAGQASEIAKDLSMITVVFKVEDNDKTFKEISPKLSSIEEFRVTRKYNGEYVYTVPGIERKGSEVIKVIDKLGSTTDELSAFWDDVDAKWEGSEDEITEALHKLSVLEGYFKAGVDDEVIMSSLRPSVALEEVRESLEGILNSIIEEEQAGEEGAEGEGEKVEGEGEGEGAEGVAEEKAEESEEGAKGEEVAVETGEELKGRFLEIMSKLDTMIKQYEEITLLSEEIETKLKSSLPEFVYVSAEHDSLLKGQVDLDELRNAPQDDIGFASIRRLLRLADLKLDELTKASSPVKRRQRLANASSNVTKILQKVWEQQKIKVSLELAGPNERHLCIWLSSDEGPVRYPEQQSYGFRWYLEFYLGYALVTEGNDKQYVLLLDEPGIHLHPLAQRNLVGVLRGIAERNQVIHTTHHTDMLDLENPESWRVVKNYESRGIGTCIVNDAYLSGEDHIGFEVITKALWGSSIVPSLWIGPKNLVVEGPSDIIMLGSISRILGSDKSEDAMLVNGEISLIHTGGISHYRKVLTFYNRPEFNIVVLFDSDEPGRNKKKELINNHIISEEKTVEINDVYPSSLAEERDLESMFGLNLLKEAAMKVYKADLPKGYNFKRDELPDKGGLGSRFKEFFQEKGIEEYNKIKVAEALKGILLENPNKLTENSRVRFRELISKIRESFNKKIE